MPLLLCPNDNSSMTTVNRSGVEFDMCPACRGVWLDRGELEKLMYAGESQGSQTAPSGPSYNRPTHGLFGKDRDDGYDHDEGRYRKKKRLDILDIFD